MIHFESNNKKDGVLSFFRGAADEAENAQCDDPRTEVCCNIDNIEEDITPCSTFARDGYECVEADKCKPPVKALNVR